eukprot:15926455-Heterocapsa_arctica.AAC.1
MATDFNRGVSLRYVLPLRYSARHTLRRTLRHPLRHTFFAARGPQGSRTGVARPGGPRGGKGREG